MPASTETAPAQASTVLTARALLLDMDGTLVDSSRSVQRVWQRWATANGFDDIEAVLRIAHGRQGFATMAELLPDRPMELNHADNERMLAEEVADTEGVVPIPGAPAFLASLADLRHALVTSADDALTQARMGAAGLRVPAIAVTAEQVTASKPDPEGFLAGAARLGVAPADCVVFEDSEAGVAAGLAAGMRVVGVGASAAAHGATVTVPDLTAVTVTAAADGTLTVTLTEAS